ncbi:hypothetical protein Pla52o_57380 [Novipirellula galeiformis]|uniref:Uncharacterized protein n=1 Tax=Novipirellula galeiformis TaxID=2528004 RepID=A0A5C6BEW9_9BACT|nr:hypothetical protein [Novipirellula galeiformis]TWU10282.1 hypothetical protein Pla52o_57380 [Novipirellula galeiformis]
MNARRSDCRTQKKRYRTCAVVGIVVLIVGTVALFPRLQRCIAYSNMLSSEYAAWNLARHPKPIQLECSESAAPIDIGYAQAALPKQWAASVTQQQHAVIVRSKDDESLVFMPPFYDSQLSPDGNYTSAVRTAESEPIALTKVFFMTSAEYAELVHRTLPKSLNKHNQRGIRLFRSENIRGLIRLGALDDPGDMSVEVWSNNGEVSQGILIHAETGEKALQLITCTLLHLRYSIDLVPPRDVLIGMIDDALTDHELLSSNPEAD